MYSLFIRKIRSSKITIKLHPGNREGGLIEAKLNLKRN